MIKQRVMFVYCIGIFAASGLQLAGIYSSTATSKIMRSRPGWLSPMMTAPLVFFS